MKTLATIREARRDDTKALLALMRCLAKRESYLDDFAITEEVLTEYMFERRSAHALVAESPTQSLIGMLVYYFLPFTYDATPWLFIKELYVQPKYRSQSIGHQLMQKAAHISHQARARKMVWSVLSENVAAQRFYQKLGAQHDSTWRPYSLGVDEIDGLRNSTLIFSPRG